MDRVLGRTAGNAVEVRESIDHLTGAATRRAPARGHARAERRAAAAGRRGARRGRGAAAAERALDGGAAAERFAAMVAELGGPPDLLEAPDRHLPQAPTSLAAEPARGRDGRARRRARGRRGGGRRSAAAARARPIRSTTRSGSPRWRRRASASARASGRWRCVHARDEETRRAGGRRAARRVHARRRRARPPAGRARGAAVIPKAELHVHLEGTAPPDLIRRLAERNGLPVPDGLFADAGALRLHGLPRLPARLRPRRERDPHRRGLPRRHLRVPGRAAPREGAIYVELTASPDHAALVGLSDEEHLDGIARGIDDARAEHGIEGRILISAVRNFGVEQALRVARYAAERPHPYVVGFSHGGRRGRTSRPATSPSPSRSRPRPASAAPCTPASGRGRRACARRSSCRSRASATACARSRTPALVERAGRARDRARVLPHEQRRARRLPELRGAPAAARCARPACA